VLGGPQGTANPKEEWMIDEQVLDQRLARLEESRTWSPRVIGKIEGHIRSASDEGLFRINALSFAKEKGIDEGEAIDLFLHASAERLFRMDWLLLCPKCSCVVESFSSLRSVNSRYRCQICKSDYEAVLDELISVTFTVSPNVREIVFHHPEKLSALDRFYKIGGTRDGRLPDEAPWVDVQISVTRDTADLRPGETAHLRAVAAEGETLVVLAMEGRAALLCQVSNATPNPSQHFDVRFSEKVHSHTLVAARPGPVSVDITNVTSEIGTIVLVVLPPGIGIGDAPLHFVPFLTGKRVLTTQTFRDLFRSDVIRAREGIGVRDISLLFTDLKGSTALYEEIGDLNAFALVQQHFDRLQEVTVRHGGAVVKTIGDAVMATFPTAQAAVGAAIEMLSEITRFNETHGGKPLLLKIGIHHGASIAVTLNERLDYFGQTVNVAARVQALADANEIYLTRDTYELPGIATLIPPSFAVEPRTASLRGIQQDMAVFRIARHRAV
jgi:class 3 adenylate cyclase